MISRTAVLSVAALVVMALGGCASTGSSPGGVVELAVSTPCIDAGDQCVSVNGESVLIPSAFDQATVEEATVVDDDGQNAVGVTFTDSGATVLHTLTAEAAGEGHGARLLVKIGDEIKASVVVMEPLDGDEGANQPLA